MKKLKIDFTIDVVTNEKIPLKEYKEKLELKKQRKSGNYYLSEVADYYYQERYGKNILQILNDKYEIPKCPVTGDLVSYKLAGSIQFGKFSSNCDTSLMTKYIAENNENYIEHINRMKKDRVDSGNPMYGSTPWNSGLTKSDDERIKGISENRKGIQFSDETLKKMSKSAKVREVHGHTGHRHSEETKQILREKTIKRLQSGQFPQTNSVPHAKVRDMLEELNIKFEEEEEIGYYVFDFKVNDTLIEVQGDYWHCNHKTRHAKPKSKAQKDNLNRDKRKKSYIKNNTNYKILYLWEYDILNKTEGVILCLKNLKK